MPMRRAVSGLLPILLAGPAVAQQVSDCGEAPPVTELVEPWEETSVLLAEGAVRLALLHGAGEEGVRLLVLTLPPGEGEEAAEPGVPAAAPPPRRCRILAEGGLGFAALDLAAIEAEEDAEAATLTVTMPARRFIPESTELEELILTLDFGLGEEALSVALEAPEEAEPEAEAPEEAPDEETSDEETPDEETSDEETPEEEAPEVEPEP